MGSKERHLSTINSIIDNSKSSNYCEPFLGSASIFLNLQKRFTTYYLNDLQEENTLAFKFRNELTRDFCKKVYTESIEKFPIASKEMYYKFRDEVFNTTNNSEPKKAIYIFRVYNTCINGMIRFNKHKFNQSYGDKSQRYNFNTMIEEYATTIESFKDKKLEVYNTSFEHLLDKKDCLYMLDPPYISNEMGCKGDFNKDSLDILIDFMLNTKEEFIYTDILNDYNKVLLNKFNYCTLDKLRKVSPSIKSSSRREEIVVWNFKQKDIFGDY